MLWFPKNARLQQARLQRERRPPPAYILFAIFILLSVSVAGCVDETATENDQDPGNNQEQEPSEDGDRPQEEREPVRLSGNEELEISTSGLFSLPVTFTSALRIEAVDWRTTSDAATDGRETWVALLDRATTNNRQCSSPTNQVVIIGNGLQIEQSNFGSNVPAGSWDLVGRTDQPGILTLTLGDGSVPLSIIAEPGPYDVQKMVPEVTRSGTPETDIRFTHDFESPEAALIITVFEARGEPALLPRYMGSEILYKEDDISCRAIGWEPNTLVDFTGTSKNLPMNAVSGPAGNYTWTGSYEERVQPPTTQIEVQVHLFLVFRTD